jgi:anti-sigma factor RsiW
MHLDAESALDFIEGRLEKDREAFWRQHIEACNDCATDIRHWQELAVNLKRSHLVSASERDLDNAVHIFPSPATEPWRLRSIFATTVFDSFLQPALAGARGGSSTARQMVMRAEEFDIHVKIWGDEDRRQMLGQVLPRNGKDFVRSARFHLLRNGERIESTATDATGEFHFTDVPEGDLSLQIDLPNLTVIGALHLKAEH